MGDKAVQLRRHIERVAAFEQLATVDRTEAKPSDKTAVTAAGSDRDGSSWSAVQMQRGFGSYGRYWVESFRIPYLTDRQIDRGFSFIGYDKIEQVRVAGYGPILVLPHLGGWEWAAAWLGRIAKVDVTAVVERLEPEEVFDWFSRLRQAFGVNVVPLGPRAMVELSASVKRRDIICLLSDRDIGGNGVGVEFFGEETTLPVGPAMLARRTGAPVLPVAVLFRGRQRVCLVGDAIWPDQFQNPDAEPGTKVTGRALNHAIIQELAHQLERLVAIAPDQWHLLEPNWPSDHEPAEAVGG